MRDLLRGYAAATLESAAVAGRARQVADELAGFSRLVVMESEPLRNVLTDAAVARPGPSRRRARPPRGQGGSRDRALVSWAVLVEPAPEFTAGVPALVELAERDRRREPPAVPAGGRPRSSSGAHGRPRADPRATPTGCSRRSTGCESIDDIENEVVRFCKDRRREPAAAPERSAIPSVPSRRRVGLVEDLLRGKVQPATAALIAYVLEAGHVRDLVGTLEWLAELAAEERGRRVAEVRSAVELDEAEYRRLADALQRTVGPPRRGPRTDRRLGDRRHDGRDRRHGHRRLRAAPPRPAPRDPRPLERAMSHCPTIEAPDHDGSGQATTKRTKDPTDA